MKILTVVGNRPQFIKAAAVSGPLRSEHREILVHTGQHHDEALSRVFFDELGLAEPDRQLGIAGGSNSSQTARMLAALEQLVDDVQPDSALVYGDTNSTLAGALAAAQAQVPVIHVEAGMRSYDRAMPEELNRVLTDHLARLLLCSSQVSAENALRESVSGTVTVVGDVMVDLAMRLLPRAQADTDSVRAHGVAPGEYLLVTAHRAGNVDQRERLELLVALLLSVAHEQQSTIVFPVHPRTRARLRDAGLLAELERERRIELLEPLPYAQLSALLCHARAVLTDSGGVQKEAYLAGVRCITLRSSTEWVETVEAGWNTLVDLDSEAALAALATPTPAQHPTLYGDGHAAERCVHAIGGLADDLAAEHA